jgi:hypothetical protein
MTNIFSSTAADERSTDMGQIFADQRCTGVSGVGSAAEVEYWGEDSRVRVESEGAEGMSKDEGGDGGRFEARARSRGPFC